MDRDLAKRILRSAHGAAEEALDAGGRVDAGSEEQSDQPPVKRPGSADNLFAELPLATRKEVIDRTEWSRGLGRDLLDPGAFIALPSKEFGPRENNPVFGGFRGAGHFTRL